MSKELEPRLQAAISIAHVVDVDVSPTEVVPVDDRDTLYKAVTQKVAYSPTVFVVSDVSMTHLSVSARYHGRWHYSKFDLYSSSFGSH